jgi:hypothetical protein
MPTQFEIDLPRKKGKQFFFSKKNQKTFTTSVRIMAQSLKPDSDLYEQKFFGSFFQKRTAFFANPEESFSGRLVKPHGF